MPADDTAFDPVRTLTVLDSHGVEYVLVGGFAAQAHGALRLRDRSGGRHAYADLATRHVANDIEGVIVHLAALDDIVASKEYAGRDKDLEALPELRLLRDQKPSSESPQTH